MKRLAKLLIPAVLMGLSVSAIADNTSIGVIDVQKIMQVSPQVKVLREQLEKQFKPRQEKLMNLNKDYQANVERLKRDSAIMTKTQKDDLQRKIVQQKRDLERQGQDYQQDLNMAQNQAMEKFFNKVRKVVDGVASKKGYLIVLQKDNVPYNSPKIDITQSVLNELK